MKQTAIAILCLLVMVSAGCRSWEWYQLVISGKGQYIAEIKLSKALFNSEQRIDIQFLKVEELDKALTSIKLAGGKNLTLDDIAAIRPAIVGVGYILIWPNKIALLRSVGSWQGKEQDLARVAQVIWRRVEPTAHVDEALTIYPTHVPPWHTA